MIDWMNPSDDILEALNIGRQDRQNEIDELEEEMKHKLIIAYSSGYEHGHHDTVEGLFYSEGRSEIHDPMAKDWLEDAMSDGTFDRNLEE